MKSNTAMMKSIKYINNFNINEVAIRMNFTIEIIRMSSVCQGFLKSLNIYCTINTQRPKKDIICVISNA